MKAVQVKFLLDQMKSTLSQSKVLLRSANSLAQFLIRCQIPSRRLKIETEGIRLDANGKCDREHLGTLLDPCGMTAPDRSHRTQDDSITDSMSFDSFLLPFLISSKF